MNSSIQNYYPHQSKAPTFTSKIKQFWSALARFVADNALSLNTDPQIWQKKQDDGFVWWVYDPATNQSMCFSSENEVRCWLDERRYNSSSAYKPARYLRH